MTPAIQDLAAQARRIVSTVENSPQDRYQLRVDFYKRYAFGPGSGYGTSELAFLKWEIDRGVLNPLDAAIPGSPWWREVNGEFCYHAQLAALIEQTGAVEAEYPAAVQLWLAYFRRPCDATWYRAHNASIVRGYAEHCDKAGSEAKAEQAFMAEVLYRVLYAQAMVEDATIFGELGTLLACPKSDSVHNLVNLPDFYPSHYPLSPEDMLHILHKGHSLEQQCVDIMDRFLILPHIEPLFRHAATWLNEPLLHHFVRDGACVYPAIAQVEAAAP